MLTDKYEFLHAVAELIVPVATETWIPVHKLLKFVFGHRGIPLASVTNAHLFAGLFKDITGVLLVLKIADTLGADNAFWPFSGHKLIEET